MPHFIGIQGNLGAGKTTVASLLAHYYKNVIASRYGIDIALFSNYYLLGSESMDDYKDWYRVADAQGSIIVWDETQRIFDSRTSLKGNQITATQILNFCRKLKSVQFFINPSIDNLDSRIRGFIEVMINVRKIGNKGISLEYFDYQSKNYGAWGKLINKRFLPASKVRQIHALNLFDTFQLVQGFPMPTTERATDQFFRKLEEHHDIARKNIMKGGKIDVSESIVTIDSAEQSYSETAV